MNENLKCSLIVYDVPSALDLKLIGGHPSLTFQKIGIRINLSAWVVPQDLIPYSYLKEIEENGVHWEAAKFDAGDAKNLVNIVTKSLKKEIRDAEEALKESMASHADKFVAAHDEAEDGDEAAAVTKKYRLAMYHKVQALTRKLKDLEAAAAGFGIQSKTGGMFDRCRKTALDMRNKAHALAEVYASAASKVKDRQLALAAAKGMPGKVLADVLFDEGQDEAAAEVSEAFSEE